jgi:DNA-binding PadR family transcriptional regulator
MATPSSRRSSGEAAAFDLPEGTIYPALHRLELAGLLKSSWMTADSGRRRRVYTLVEPAIVR